MIEYISYEIPWSQIQNYNQMHNSKPKPTNSPKKDPLLQREMILQNPFHPLDLSAHDLLIVYKKFDISREINRNPKQQLPIQTITQLISSLKGCKPSYIQKCMSLALIKDSISWNQFLAFLDQQSQVRSKILDWIMHQKTIIKCKFQHQIPFRSRIFSNYQIITDISFVHVAGDQFMIATLDHREIILTKINNDNRIQKVDEFNHKNIKQIEQVDQRSQTQTSLQARKSTQITANRKSEALPKTKNQIKDRKASVRFRSLIKIDTTMLTDIEQRMQYSALSKESADDQVFYKKQRKNIHNLFHLFNQVPLEQSRKVAEFANQKIESRSINASHVIQIKQNYQQFTTQKKPQTKPPIPQHQPPLQSVKKKLKKLHQQKGVLSYNPYKIHLLPKANTDFQQPRHSSNQKKLYHDRKQKQYLIQAVYQKFCPQLNCIGIIYHNLQLCLIKITKQFNKTIFQQQDTIKIYIQKDFKKNIIVEMFQFHFHRATNKWLILVLFRSQHKQQVKGQNDSFIRGYQIQLKQGKRKGQLKCAFEKKKQQFVIDIGKNQIIKILSQKDYGLHLISYNGRYFTWKEDYKHTDKEVYYFKKDNEQRFKGASVSLSCITIIPTLNKALLGTVKGMMITYDIFSRQYKINKVLNCLILQIEVKDQQAFILGENQKLVVWDIVRNQEVQHLSVKNQQKLHEKVTKMVLSQDRIICYGSCIRVFKKFIDESLQQQKFKMQNIYTWRLNKLDQSRGVQSPLKLIPSFRQIKTNAQLLVKSQNYFIILTQIQQAIFFISQNMQVKFTTILNIPHDQKVMKITVSTDQKLMGVLLFNQNIYIFNIFTEELILYHKSTPFQKYTTLCFLDSKNQYLLAAGTELGKIILLPYQSVPEKQAKVLDFHTQAISITTLYKGQLITSSENREMAVWQLPYNILKQQIKIKQKVQTGDFVIDKLGSYSDSSFFRTSSGVILQLSASQGTIKSAISQFKSWQILAIDAMLGYLFGVEKPGEIVLYQRKADKDGWTLKKRFQIDSKHQIIGIGICQSQKAIFFTKTGMYTWLYRNQRLSKFRSFFQNIV